MNEQMNVFEWIPYKPFLRVACNNNIACNKIDINNRGRYSQLIICETVDIVMLVLLVL